MAFVSERFGLMETRCCQARPLATPLKQIWKRAIRGHWPMRYLPADGLVIGPAGAQRSTGAWSLETGKPVWENKEIVFGYNSDLSVFDGLVHAYHKADPAERGYAWLDRETGAFVEPAWEGVGPPLGRCDGGMLIETEEGLSRYDPQATDQSLQTTYQAKVVWGLVFQTELGLVGTMSTDRSGNRRLCLFDPDESELRWQRDSNELAVAMSGRYMLISLHGGASERVNTVIDHRTGQTLWQLPARVKYMGAFTAAHLDAQRDVLITMGVPYFDKTDGVYARRLSTGELLWEHTWDPADGSGSLFVAGQQVWHAEPAGEKQHAIVARDQTDGRELYRLPLSGKAVRVEWIDGDKLLVRKDKTLLCYSGAA